MKKKMEIPAECHSDDGVVECSFDAVSWFRGAVAKEILDLAKCGWGGDYPADEIAISMAKQDEDIAFMFNYIEYKKRHESDIGFECHVQETEAMAWLEKNRRLIFKKIQKALTEEK
jgi:hypothetical protein